MIGVENGLSAFSWHPDKPDVEVSVPRPTGHRAVDNEPLNLLKSAELEFLRRAPRGSVLVSACGGKPELLTKDGL